MEKKRNMEAPALRGQIVSAPSVSIEFDEGRKPASAKYRAASPNPNYSEFKYLATYQLIYSLAGLILGALSILGGVAMLLHGVSGATKSWTADLLGLRTSFSDIPAGVTLFVVGIFLVWITKFDFTVKKARG